MPRKQRDYKAEYAARQARAKAAGFKSYAEQRSARKAGQPDPAKYRKIAAEKRKAAEKIREVTRRQIHQLPDTTLVTTTTGGAGWATIHRQLAGHGTRPVVVHLIMRNGKRRTVYGNGISAKRLKALLAAEHRGHGGGAGCMEDIAALANEVQSYGEAISGADIKSAQFELGDAV